MIMPDYQAIAAKLGHTPPGSPRPVGGGCIHNACRWGAYFIKTNTPDELPNFQAEATGLAAIAATGTIRVPEVIAHGRADGSAFLVLEHLELHSSGNEARLGEQLAALHRHTAERFGFANDNFLGSTPQPNQWTPSWPEFFRDQRIGHLLGLLAEKGVTFPEAGRFLERLPTLLPESPPASLLHGDLWSGNKAFLADGTPVIFDPACYHGHAAAELAMTTLFGGFGPDFHDAYRSSGGADDPSLHDIYNLHHILNHALLFGGGYATQARGIMSRFI